MEPQNTVATSIRPARGAIMAYLTGRQGGGVNTPLIYWQIAERRDGESEEEDE